MNQCPFCNASFSDDPHIHALLLNEQLVESIQLKHPNWNPKDLACDTCLTDFYKEFSKQNKALAHPEEPTVIITSNRLIVETASTQVEACLIMIHGPKLGQKFSLTLEPTVLGRGEQSGIQLLGENVSRHHSEVFCKGNEFFIKDLGSTNGTFVNTRKIVEHKLTDGDLILVGNCILKFISGSNVETAYYEDMYRMAIFDGLTACYNKMFFLGKLDEEFRRAKRYARDLSMILFDFDHFSKLNNTFGHLSGDYILKTVSHLIAQNIRKEDFLCRYGGEEFAIILPEVGLESAFALSEKIRKLIETHTFEHGGKTIPVTLSLGVVCTTKHTKSGKELLLAADAALYRSKDKGRNRTTQG